MLQAIEKLLPPGHPWRQRLIYLESVDSTNTYLKSLARQGAAEGTLVFAHEQTGGRGRLGRSFSSPAGSGLYFSLLLRPDCPPQELMHLTCAAGVAVSEGICAACGVEPGIKWTNDLILNGKKLGGILTEMSIRPDGLGDWAIVGIGINCNQLPADFPPEIESLATSLRMALGQAPDKAALAAALVSTLYQMRLSLFDGKEEMMAHFTRCCVTIGQSISIVRGSEVHHATATGVDENGGLQVVYPDGKTDTVTSGEVSIRGMYGYV